MAVLCMSRLSGGFIYVRNCSLKNGVLFTIVVYVRVCVFCNMPELGVLLCQEVQW